MTSILSIDRVREAAHIISNARKVVVLTHMSPDGDAMGSSLGIKHRLDTVFLEKWHTRWRNRETIKTDTVTNEVVRTETVPVRYIPSFYKYGTALAILLLLLLLAKFALYLFMRR